MCLFHLTGDNKWLNEPYRPARDVRLIADPGAGFDPATATEIREAVLSLVADGVPEAVVNDPGPTRFGDMLSIFLGERVPDEYVQLVREDMGIDDGDASWTDDEVPTTTPDVVIVGTGVFGLCLASKLDRLGIDFTMLERNDEVGGTWRNNRYPGCGVDTPNHFYSYSFAPNPSWRRYFSQRDELQDYLERFATDSGLRDRIQFGTTVTGARWDEHQHQWSITTTTASGQQQLEAQVFVVATGHFDEPAPVNIAGLDEFEGDVLHTARWPDDASLADKRVAVIGTGASSMQLVPTIAEEVAHLTVFQRTPQWVRPVDEYDQEVNPAAQWLFENLPWYARWYRFGLFWRYGDGLLRFLRKDPEWPHPERSLNRTNDRHRQEMTDFIEAELADHQHLIDDCLPTYPPFAKRILIDNGWFSTLRRDHVDLVAADIDRCTANGIVTVDGRTTPVDTIVLATGFTITNLAARLDIVGRHGSLADDWADDNPTAWLGMTVPGFPNLFVMYGPNTNVGHGGSGMWLAENQSRYIASCLVALAESGESALDVKTERRTTYTEEIDALHDELVWTHPGLTTYYRTSQGRVRSPMPFRLVDYWERTHEVDLGDFNLTTAQT